MYNASEVSQNAQIKINANKDRIMETNFFTSCLAFRGFILTNSY